MKSKSALASALAICVLGTPDLFGTKSLGLSSPFGKRGDLSEDFSGATFQPCWPGWVTDQPPGTKEAPLNRVAGMTGESLFTICGGIRRMAKAAPKRNVAIHQFGMVAHQLRCSPRFVAVSFSWTLFLLIRYLPTLGITYIPTYVSMG